MSSRPGALSRLLVLLVALVGFQPLVIASAQPSSPDGSEIFNALSAAKTNIDPNDTEQARYIVQLRGAPLATSPGLPRKDGAGKLDLQSPEARTRAAELAAERSAALDRIGRALGARVSPLHVYETAFNGVALRLTGAQAARVAALPGVAAVQREQVYELNTDAGPSWIGADQVWDASATGVYAATILGANENPPVTSPLRGRGTFSLDGTTLSYTVVITGFTGASPIDAAHFHRGAANESGPVIAPLTAGSAPGSYAGSVELAPADLALLDEGGVYVNFHTAANPSGEVRGNLSGYKGEGVVVGIIDSGINTTHPSFAAVGGDGYRHLNPLGPGKYKGACDPTNLPAAPGNPSGYNAAVVCNDKLIGAWTFPETAMVPSPGGEPSPNDDDGHGSHTASTAAGNVLRNITLDNLSFPQISGVAPHANIIAYDVCGYDNGGGVSGSCPNAALLAAVDQAVEDGVDVINYSISGGDNPWTDPVEIAFRNARAAGVVVSTSAGNNGPSPGTVAHISPWLLSVAATTHNRAIVNTLTDLSSASGSLPDIVGAGSTDGLPGSVPIVYAGSPAINNPLCAPFTAAQAALVTGTIVICDSGWYYGHEQSVAVGQAGGVGFVLANAESEGDVLYGGIFFTPGLQITHADGAALKAWVAASSNPTARISGETSGTSPAGADIVADFSSRGPRTGALATTLKPDIAAPGVDVLAAVANDGAAGADYWLLSGTSMASPHVAGAAALLAGLHPGWSPGQVQSALMTTALSSLRKEDRSSPATPFDSGAGRVRLERAARAGLLLDETNANFVGANPGAGGDPRALNVPSMADPECVSSCSWTRTARNPLDVAVTWTAATSSSRLTVTPASFSIPPGGTQSFAVSYNVSGLPTEQYVFGRVTFSAAGGLAPDASFPVAAQPKNSSLPGMIRHSAETGVSATTVELRAVGYSGLSIQQSGMVRGTAAPLLLGEGQKSVSTLLAPADTARLVAEIQESTAVDLDLFVYRDEGNGAFDGYEELACSRYSRAVLESCSLSRPEAGTYFILVENYEASEAGTDPVRLVSAVVPETPAGNLVVEAPGSSPGGAVSLELGFNLPASRPGDRWYGAISLTTVNSGVFLGEAAVDFRHAGDPPPLRQIFLPAMGR